MFKKYILNNGVTVINYEVPNSKSISCYGYYPIGVATEPIKQIGITHLLEHLMFTGIENYPSASSLAAELDKKGIIAEGLTYRDLLSCGIQSQVEDFIEGASLLINMLLDPYIKKESFEIEKKIIKEEIEYYSSDPEIKIWGDISANIWGETHPLGRRVEGHWNTMESLKLEEVQDYFNQYCRADNLTLVISGSIKLDILFDLFSLIEKRFPMPINKKRISHNIQAETLKGINNPYEIITKDVVWMGWGFPLPTKKVDRFKTEIIQNLLTDGNSSVLKQSLIDNQGIAFYVSSDLNLSKFGGDYSIVVCSELGKIEEVRKKVEYELDQLENFSEESLALAKKNYIAKLIFSVESTKILTRYIGRNYMNHNCHLNIEEICRYITDLKSEDIRSYLKGILRR